MMIDASSTASTVLLKWQNVWSWSVGQQFRKVKDGKQAERHLKQHIHIGLPMNSGGV